MSENQNPSPRIKIRLSKQALPIMAVFLFILVLILIVKFIIKKQPGDLINPQPQTTLGSSDSQSPNPTPEEESTPNSPPPEQPPTSDGKKDNRTAKKCCTDALTGEDVPRPPSARCVEYEFGKRTDPEKILSALKGIGLTLAISANEREVNGAISSLIGQASLSKYLVSLNTRDTYDYTYDPPYFFKNTPCTQELKQKIIQTLDSIK